MRALLSAISMVVVCLSVGCVAVDASSDLEPAEGGAIAETAAPAEETGTISEDVAAPIVDAPECGVIACDEGKVFHPKIHAAYLRAGDVGEPVELETTKSIYVHAWGSGRVQHFAKGVTLAETDAGKTGYVVKGAIRSAWLRLGGGPKLGMPIEDEHAGPGGIVQTFEKGCIGPDGSGELDVFSACEEPGDLAPVLSKVRQTINARSNKTSVAMGVMWLPSGKRWTEFGDEKHVSASSPKWSWAMAAVLKSSVASVEPAALPTFKTSDNGTAGTLIDLAGGIDAVNDFTIKQLGIPQESFNLCYWNAGKTRRASSCSNAMDGNNYFTPNGVLTFLDKAWKRAVVGREKGDKVLEWAKLAPRTGMGGWLGTQLPAAAKASMLHKAGWLPPGCCSSDAKYNNMNEIGIVMTARGPYAVAILLDHGTDYWGAQTKSMEWASCVIHHAFAKDVADPFAAGCTSP